jgi:hypothetical protein
MILQNKRTSTRLSPPKMLSGANTFEISDHEFKPRKPGDRM